jgi:hypothetical protein
MQFVPHRLVSVPIARAPQEVLRLKAVQILSQVFRLLDNVFRNRAKRRLYPIA